MDEETRICLIGEVCVDLTLTDPTQENKLRFGGVVHPARALWALDVPYLFGYTGPDYLTRQVEKYVNSFGASVIQKIGNVIGSPNVIFIAEPKETGPQGYEFILRDEYQNSFNDEDLTKLLKDNDISDIIIFAGKFSLSSILEECQKTKAKIHIDLGNASGDLAEILPMGNKVETIFLSTSSEIFNYYYQGSIARLQTDVLDGFSQSFVFKENRGGSRYFTKTLAEEIIQVGAQLRPIVHSVGVGDCFDVVFVEKIAKHPVKTALSYASWIAAEYAATTYPDDFRAGCERIFSILPEEIVKVPGITLAWEERPTRPIYIAAPDFDYLDRSQIEKVINSLRYHNFNPRLPIRENGQMGVEATAERKEQLFTADIKLLDECDLVIAVLIENDPGTLIEIGLSKAMGIPVIVYDPYGMAKNLMLTQLPDLVSSDLDLVISKVFEIFSKG